MIPYYITTLKLLNKLRVKYIIGADSLVALSEGNLFKYSKNLVIFIFPRQLVRLLTAGILMLFHRIILKPKSAKGNLYFRVRFKPTLFTKLTHKIKVSILRKTIDGYSVYLGGELRHYSAEDLAVETTAIDGIEVPVPADMDSFVDKYRDILMTRFYKTHTVTLDCDSETEAVDLMFSVSRILTELNVEYWIEGGTLLGAVRDGKLIPWDHDLDFGMKFTSNPEMKKIIHQLKKKYYVSIRHFTDKEGIWQLGEFRVLKISPRHRKIFKDDLCLDLFVYYRGELPGTDEEDVYMYGVWGHNAYHETEHFDTIEEMEFYGGIVPVPANVEKFLETKYGADWRIPKKQWNVALDDGSIQETENL